LAGLLGRPDLCFNVVMIASGTAAAGPGSLTWLWILIGVVVVVAVVLVVLAGRGFGPLAGRRSVVLGGWLGGAIDAYEKGLALHQAIGDAVRPGAAAADGAEAAEGAESAEARWAGIERGAAELDRLLHTLRTAAADPEDRAAADGALGSLRELRSAIDDERSRGGADADQAEAVRARLAAFEASLRGLRPPERHLW
jgi:hypothetical protein